MKVIFLDIGEVLNCDRTRGNFARLDKLLSRTRAKVVLSSSWRPDPVGLLAAKHSRPGQASDGTGWRTIWPAELLLLKQVVARIL
jgi:hypothetical protein